MTEAVLLDTHAWAWSMLRDPRLSETAAEVLNGETPIMISPISAFEIGQKVRLGKWPEMTPFAWKLESYVEWQDATIAPVTLEIADFAARLAWDHRDPIDRLIAATALVHGWALISADTAFDSLIGLRRLW